MKLRVLIADDEPLGRQRLRYLLRNEPGSEVVAECVSGTETVNSIRKNTPDLVFLDVMMPELDGFGVLEALKGIRLPAIIFVTAYDRFAVRAFEANAVDYLLKPFARERFQSALHRARERLRLGHSNISEQSILKLLMDVGKRVKPLERLTIKSDGRITLLNTAEIDWVRAADNYVELHVASASHLLRMTMTELASQLSPSRFVRISRSYLVNLDQIKEMRSASHGDYVIVLQNGTKLLGTRNYRQNLTGLRESS
jgi:two-component system, LytTR family, response regulator